MRILAVSDIHGRVSAFDELLARESGSHDLVLVAGDIGAEVLPRLKAFERPVAFVLGNHDQALGVRPEIATGGQHVHLSPLQLGEWFVVGMDFAMLGWSAPPQAVRQQLAALVQELGPERCIVVTHERLTKTKGDLAGVPLFVYGHFHTFELKRFRGAAYVNPGALGEVVTMRPIGGDPEDYGTLRNAVTASYAVIEMGADGAIEVAQRQFRHASEGWELIYYNGRPNIWPGKPEMVTGYVDVED